MRVEQAEVQEVLTPVRASDIDRDAKRGQDQLVDAYLKWKNHPLLGDDGEPLKHDNGRPKLVTQVWYADRIGVSQPAFNNWLKKRGERDPDEKRGKGILPQRDRNPDADDDPQREPWEDDEPPRGEDEPRGGEGAKVEGVLAKYISGVGLLLKEMERPSPLVLEMVKELRVIVQEFDRRFK